MFLNTDSYIPLLTMSGEVTITTTLTPTIQTVTPIQSTINASVFNKLGIRVKDPGFRNTVVSTTNISSQLNGVLLYRGYDISTLVNHSSFLESTYLLIYKNLPTSSQLSLFINNVMSHTYIPTDLESQIKSFRYNSNPVGILIATTSSLSTFHPDANPALMYLILT